MATRSDVWLLGIRPSRRAATALLPTGKRSNSADRLRRMLGMTVKEFLAAFPQRANVLDRVRGHRLAREVKGTVYVLGREAWRCLDLPWVEFFHSHGRAGAVFFLIPHPSGKSLIYNEEHNRTRLRRLMCRHSSGSTSTATTSSSREPESPDLAPSRGARG